MTPDHALRQASCSLCSTLLPCFTSSVFPWFRFVFVFFVFFLFTQLAWRSACLSAYVMMNSLHGYNDPTVSWQSQASLLGCRRPRVCSPSPGMSSLGRTALKLTQGQSSRPTHVAGNQGASGNFHTCPLLGVGFCHCFF